MLISDKFNLLKEYGKQQNNKNTKKKKWISQPTDIIYFVFSLW